MSVLKPYFGQPWWLLLLVPMVALLLLSYGRLRRRGVRPLRRTAPLLLRLTACVLAVLMAADLSFLTNWAGLQTIILLDVSDSMAVVTAQAEQDAQTIAGKTGGIIIPFAGDAIMTAQADSAALSGDITDIGKALHQIRQLFGENQRQRVILLTDGLETDGSMQKQTAAMVGSHVRVDAVQYPTWSARDDVEVVSIALPQQLALGQTTSAAITVQTNAAASIQLTLYDEETAVYSSRFQLPEGLSTYHIRVTPTQSGLHMYRAEITSEKNGYTQNDAAACCMNVVSSAKILLLDGSGQEGEALKELLTAAGYDVDRLPVKDVPPNVASMCQYGLIVLMNVDTQDLKSRTAAAMDEYISRYGCSVLWTGGDNTYAYGHLHDTDYESFLPVEVQVEDRESAESVALLLLVDNSASMGESATSMASDSARPIEMAKLGAIKSISLLHENDCVGVISFSNKAHVLSELAPLTDKDQVIATVARMGLISGTMYTEALNEALRQYSSFTGNEKKHIIFLSDGNPSDDDYMSVVEQLKSLGVTISTIAIGSSVSTDVLQRMAETTGGRYAHATEVANLPSLMMSDTILQQVTYTVETLFSPEKNPTSSLLADMVLPSLSGYVRVQAKPNAETILYAEKGRPLYSRWYYGNGQAACFMSDLSGRWSQAWLDTAEGQAAILDMIADLLPEETVYSTLDMTIQHGGRDAVLRVSFPEPQPGMNCEADVIGPDGSVQSLRLLETEPGVYERNMALAGYGRYNVTLYQYDPSDEIIATHETALAVLRSTEYDAFPDEDVQNVLSDVCAMTGGQVYQNAQDVLNASVDSILTDNDPSRILASLAGILFLLEMILRHVNRRMYRKRSG